MEFKGTKGEWYYHSGENIGVATKKPTLIIADVELDKDIPVDEQIANAKLIAASPELLNTLIAFVEANVLSYEEERIALKAINKALK